MSVALRHHRHMEESPFPPKVAAIGSFMRKYGIDSTVSAIAGGALAVREARRGHGKRAAYMTVVAGMHAQRAISHLERDVILPRVTNPAIRSAIERSL